MENYEYDGDQAGNETAENLFRITKFDTLIKGRKLTKTGDNSLVTCYMSSPYLDRTNSVDDNIPITGDIIDAFLDFYCTGKYTISLYFMYIIDNTDEISIEITDRDNLTWYTDADCDKLYFRIKFLLSEDQYSKQIKRIRDMGYSSNIISFGEGDYIDYGEVNPECVISCTIDKNAEWRISRYNALLDTMNPNEEAQCVKEISIDIEKSYRDIKVQGSTKDVQEKQGLISLTIITNKELFEKDAIKNAAVIKDEAVYENTNRAIITIRTDDDCKFPEEPDGYMDYALHTEVFDDVENTNPKFVEYENSMNEAIQRNLFWNAVFETTSPLVNSILKIYIDHLNSEINNDGSHCYIQVHMQNFVEWIVSIDSRNAHKFFDVVNEDIERIKNSKSIGQNINVALDTTYNEDGKADITSSIENFIISDTVRELYKHVVQIIASLETKSLISQYNSKLSEEDKTQLIVKINESTNTARNMFHKIAIIICTDNKIFNTNDPGFNAIDFQANPVYRYIYAHIPDLLGE